MSHSSLSERTRRSSGTAKSLSRSRGLSRSVWLPTTLLSVEARTGAMLCTRRRLLLSLTCLASILAFSGNSYSIGGELSKEEAKDGFVSIFDGKTLAGWQGDTKGYEAEDGILVCTKSGRRLDTVERYGNFIFRFECKLPPGGNNGISVRGMEIQILDDDAPRYANLKPCQYHGSIYCHVPAKRGHQKPTGEWNEQEIRINGKHVKVTLNGVTIMDAETDHGALKKPSGPVGFLGHHHRIEFRNIRVKELPTIATTSEQ